MITFTIPGKITSANRVTRHVGNRSIKSASARTDQERIRSLANGYALLAYALGPNGNSREIVVPTPASVSIVAWNSRLDADNLPKCVLDGIKGVLIVNDSPKHLRRLLVEHRKDTGGERYDVSVDAV